MSGPNITRWMGIGLLGLPLYGALSFYSNVDPQPDPNTHYGAWARHVTTDHYLLEHLFLSDLGLILAIFGTFALGAYLATSRAGRMRDARHPGADRDDGDHGGGRPCC
jgi:hypothetical protein